MSRIGFFYFYLFVYLFFVFIHRESVTPKSHGLELLRCAPRAGSLFFIFFYVFVLTASAVAYTRHTYTNCVYIIRISRMTLRVLYQQPPLLWIILLYYDKCLHIYTLTRNDAFSSYLYYYARCIFYFQFFFLTVIRESVKRKGTEMSFFVFQLPITDLKKINKSTTEELCISRT